MNTIKELKQKGQELKQRFEKFHLPDRHDQQTHGNDSGQSQIDSRVHDAFKKANDSWPGERKATPEQLQKVVEYVRGRKGVDVLKLSDHTGISVGLADHLNKARKEYFRSSGPSPMRSREARINDFLKQKWITK